MDKAAKVKYGLIKGMHEIICRMNDETAYMNWCYVVSDYASEEDFLYIAEDDELFDSAVLSFMRQVKYYGKYGLYINETKKLYGGTDK